jgi:hypothetical protein
MTVPDGLFVLGVVLVVGAIFSRRAQRGYIDFLTPLLAMYLLHTITRSAFDFYLPDWLSLNPRVAAASEEEIAQALFITAASVAALIVSYLIVTRLRPSTEPGSRQMAPVSLRAATNLLCAGIFFRLLLRMVRQYVISLPQWAWTPIETFGWAALAGIFLLSFGWARGDSPSERKRAMLLAIFGVIAVLGVDAQLAVSREQVLQPILALLVGRMMGAGVRIRRIALVAVIAGIPIFLWIGAMKQYLERYERYEAWLGPWYLNSVNAVQDQAQHGWGEFIIGSIQNRFHGVDSLIVVRQVVPSSQPYEEGSVWLKILLSAFVPRVIYPEKTVGWGWRFAAEFWGANPRAEGRYAIGISHLGNFYVYGGIGECLAGMAILGAGLGWLAAYLRRRGDVLGLLMFFLVALTICQVDRDLEVSLGGVLKLLTLFAGFMFLRRSIQFSSITLTQRREHFDPNPSPVGPKPIAGGAGGAQPDLDRNRPTAAVSRLPHVYRRTSGSES